MILIENYFFIVFLITIIVTRIFLYIKPMHGPTLRGIRIHHYMYGIILMLVSVAIKNVTLYAIGIGLLVDEFTFVFIVREKDNKASYSKTNYSKTSLIGIVILILMVFLARKSIIPF